MQLCAPPPHMKAAVHTRYGPPNVVQIVDVDAPSVGERDVLVEVHATTVNRTDCAFRSAKPFVNRFFSGPSKPKTNVLGCEFAGVVEAVGSGVTSFAVGERVFGFSEGRFGAHAEYLTMPEGGSLATMPANVTYEVAAASTEGSHYALSMITKAKIRSGHHVLVNGATGAIGSASVQLLKRLGAVVTATCGTEHEELVRGLGAERVIDYRIDDFTEDSRTYDAVLDAVGKSSFGRCRRLLKPRGVYASSDLGRWAQNPILALVTPLLRGKKVVFPIPPKYDQAQVRCLKEMVEAGDFTPVIDRRYPLDRIVEAYTYVEAGMKIGNVVIVVESAS
jgi:NADPH:quinone reductase-like Zn-dependent oxidoreductase